MKKTDLNSFNVGKSHGENPLGGIPIGKGNSVEQNETKSGDFVYSDRIKLTKDIIGNYNLPKNLAGKTVADATKFIDNKFKDRTDKISESTKNKMLQGIAAAQEEIKTTQYPEQPITNQMFLGGSSGSLMSGASTAGSMLPNNTNLSNTPRTAQEEANANMWESTKDGVASAIPIAGIFRGVEKAGKGLGQSIGGDYGGDVASGFLDPVSTVTNKDTNFGEKTLSLLDPIASGIILANKNKHRREAAERDAAITAGSQYTNDFAYGGNLNPYFREENRNPDPDFVPNLNTNVQTPMDYSGYTSPYDKANLKPLVNWAGENYGNIMRYAPVATNALQLANLKKPSYEALNRLDNRFNREYVDERSLQNIATSELNNTTNALAGATNGSIGALRSNILGAGLNRNKALSDAYMNAEAQNRATNATAQQFNASIDQTNLQQANLELDINDRNQAAYDNNKSRLISAIGEDVGNIGKEEVYKKIAKQMYGYTWDGKYWTKPDGTKISDEQVKQEVNAQSGQKKLGGMLLNNRNK